MTSAKRSIAYKSPQAPGPGLCAADLNQYSSERTIKKQEVFKNALPVQYAGHDEYFVTKVPRQRFSDIREEHDSQMTTQKTEQSNEKVLLEKEPAGPPLNDAVTSTCDQRTQSQDLRT